MGTRLTASILPFLGLFLACGCTHGQNPVFQLVLNSSLMRDTAHDDFQKVAIECYMAKVLPSHDSGSITTSRSSSNYIQSMPDEEALRNSEFKLLMNGSFLYSSPSVIVNYTSVQMDKKGLRATFYLSKTEQFFGHFVCNYVNKTKNSSIISSATLSLIYAPYYQDGGNTWKYLTVVFFCLFLTILLVLGVIIAMVKYRFHINQYQKSAVELPERNCGYEEKSLTTRNFNITYPISSHGASHADGKKQLKLFCSETCFSQEEVTNALLLYLAHPTPCLQESCPCIQYKQVLNEYKLASTKPIERAEHVSRIATCDDVVTDNAVILEKRNSVLLSDSTLQKTDFTSVSKEDRYIVVYPDINLPSLTSSPTLLCNSDSSTYFVDPPDVFVVGSSGGRYSNEDHQVYLRVQEGSVPKGRTVKIKIGISLTSSLVSLLPPENLPVSPVVSFHVEGEDNFEFLKPVEIILPHFVDIEDEEDAKAMDLAFLKAGCNLYCFHQSKGVATFRPKSHTASLKTKHFCSFCIVANKRLPVEKIHYRLVKIIPRNQQLEQWRISFCVTYYLRTCLEVLKKQYPEGSHEIKPLKRFKFPKSEYISIHFERRLPGGWQLALETSDNITLKKIYAKNVEYWSVDPEQLELMEEEGQYPPRFEVQVSSSQAREAVNAHISFEGVMGDDDLHDGVLTELILQPSMSPVWHHRTMAGYSSMSSSYSMPVIGVTHSPTIPRHIQPSSLKLSTYPSQSDLMNLVAAPLPTKWRLVGIQLGLSMSTLDEIENSHPHDCKRCFMSVFSAWESQGTSPYSWTTIVEALRSSCVEENVAAAKIEQTMANYSESISLCSNSTSCSSGYQSTEEFSTPL